MSFPSNDPSHVFRDFVTNGVPSSGAWNPHKPEIRRLLKEYEAAIIALIGGQGGDIDLARGVIHFAVTGGTADALIAEPDADLPENPGSAIFILGGIAQDNTGPVTINDKPLRTNSGNDILPGGLTAGSIHAFLDLGDHFRLLSDQASASIVAAAEGWADDAENAADRAEAAAALISADKIKFKTVPLLLADTSMSYTADPGKIHVVPGDRAEADGFRYEVAASGASDHHVETAGGIKLKVFPDKDGYQHTLAWGAAGDDVTDDADIIQKIADYTPFIHFDAQHFVGTTIQLQSCARLRGGIMPSYTNPGANGTNISWVRSTRAALGDGGAIFRTAPVGEQSQSFVAENLGFVGDLAFDPFNIAATPDQGIYGVDVSGLKNGAHFFNCWFRQLRKGVYGSGSPYTDQIVFWGCFWSRNYEMVDCPSTAGLAFFGSMAYEQVTLVNTSYNAEFHSCTIQNSSASSIETAIKARNIIWTGGWIETLIVPFQPTHSAHITGLWAGEGTSIGGAGSRFLFKFVDGMSVIYENSRIPTNTRFGTFTAASNLASISIEINGAYDGENFGDLAAIGNYTGQINYRGSGNTNSDLWNGVFQRIRTIPGSNYTMQASDIGKILRITSGTGITITLPDNATIPLPVGSEVTIVNASGSAAHTIASGDSILHPSGSGSRTLGERGSITLLKTAPTAWHVVSAVGVT